MNKKRNVSYIKPEDPEFLKVLKKQAGYDDKNHKFDELENAEEDFVSDDDSEKPQVVVLKEGDLNADEAEAEAKKIEKEESEKKADLTQKVIFKKKTKSTDTSEIVPSKKKKSSKVVKKSQLLSFDDDEEEDES